MTSVLDPIALAQALIRCPSVTPADEGAMDILQRTLEGLGFRCRRMKFGEIENLYARRGTARPNLCFAGHTDVVPVGDAGAWKQGPFEAQVIDGLLYGRGAVDMKSAIAAFASAVAAVGDVPGSLSFLITGDEEGVALDGTAKVVQLLASKDEVIDHCVVGEPSSSAELGDMIKIGRRGSLNAWLTVDGQQGHVAYPHRAANPIPVMIDLLARLKGRVLDEGYESFQPSNLEVTNFDVGNTATNVIPAQAVARLNIRFNPAHKGADLMAWIEDEVAKADAAFKGKVSVRMLLSGEAFLTPRGDFTSLVAEAARAVTGREPELSTTGGTSDARFIRSLCPVVEFGLVGATMHMVNECAPVEEIRQLTAIYRTLIERYFERFS
ncbi:succinyl-diaminopimelate desuccinylase [Caulobacter ginsengisoli]|uniref:Succinyl-diaminopimelate desuccinylase n=1 Tax=Caulobacter ginsengisoli TaxID=400775 RepID=A0ABU0IWL1_9CAUL|nr:succinyl-diaminopimelate desuccinylase [Caulobacter ginsengisoli]MDQ0466407.1 succinyl-diaminopimelate desuccinylase [Caulobacter ginsengisoli]